MDKSLKIEEYANLQYQNTNNLTNRANLWTFGDNPVPLGTWIMQNLDIKNGDSILELGCGKGFMWCGNKDLIPPEISLTMTDFSEGMVKSTTDNFKNAGIQAQICQINPKISFLPINLLI